jgi:hypothetical protein
MKLTTALSFAARRVGMYKGLWVLLWFAFTASSMVFVVPAVRSLMPLSRLPEGGPKYLPGFDLGFAVEWAMQIVPGAPAILVGVLLPLIGIVLLVHVLVSGGAIYRLLHRGRVLDGAGLYFWRFIRLALISLLFYGVAIALISAGNNAIDKPVMIGGWVMQVAGFLLLGLVATIFDYAKVRLAVDSSRKSWRAAFGSARLVLTNPGKTMGAWAAICVVGLLFFVLWRSVENAIEARTLGAVLLLLAVQQIYVLSRVWIRLMFWGVAIELDSALRTDQGDPGDLAPAMAGIVTGPSPMRGSAQAEPPADDANDGVSGGA